MIEDLKQRPDESRTYETRLDGVRARIGAAASRCGRATEHIALLAVSKQQPAAAVRQLAALGIRDFGESYLQEALRKQQELADLALNWHYIGQLQTNKTRPIATTFAWVHTIDRLNIAQRLSEQRPTAAQPLNVCVQVKLAEEPGKGGIAPSDVLPLAKAISQLSQLRLRGLMTIPPPEESYQKQLIYFERLKELAVGLRNAGLNLDTLSMGMSADLEAAITAGATIVRIGTALFGERVKT